MVELNFFIFQIVKFYKIVDYLGNWLIFQIRIFSNFSNWKFLGSIQNIELWNGERLGFRNFKITNIKKWKMSYFFINEFIFLFLNKI